MMSLCNGRLQALLLGLLGFMSIVAATSGDAAAAGVSSVKETTPTGAFSQSVVMIIATELGDKTFFIAALLAMRHAQGSVLLGAFAALASMTALSTTIGFVLPNLLPRVYTHWAAVFLFVYFGLRGLYEAAQMFREGTGTGPSDELEEVEQSLKDEGSPKNAVRSVAMQALSLTFLAEWGDKSQIATIALAASEDPIGVTLGGIFGHFLCTSLAVFGGRVLAARIPERIVVAVGGVVFLLFAAHGAIVGAAE